MLRRLARRVAERVLGYEVELSGRTIVLIDPARRADAWFSYHSTLRDLFSTHQITQVLDVGANTGQFATSLRSFFDGDIHSFEPVASTYAELKARASGDPRWHVHQYGLGAESGERVIHVAPSADFSSLLKSTNYCVERFGQQSAQVRNEAVTLRRLEDVLPELMPHVDRERLFLKLDTQGFDLEVFRGLGAAAGSVVAMQSEVSLIPLYEEMPHWTESLAAFERAGFGIVGFFPISRDSGRVVEYDCLLARAIPAARA